MLDCCASLRSDSGCAIVNNFLLRNHHASGPGFTVLVIKSEFFLIHQMFFFHAECV
jgi:hypothetical protein